MKIAIFGDSYADDHSAWSHRYTGVGPGWPDYLRSQNIEVDNYSLGGTSLYYSYQKFILKYQEYDKIIFVVTHSGRISVPVGIGNQEEYYVNAALVEDALKNCFDFERKIKLAAIRDYFLYVKNDKFDNLVHKLLIEDISRKHEVILMIPAFPNSGIDNQIPLIDISFFESKFWNLNWIYPDSDAGHDARKCHMCEENNLMLGKEIYNWVKTGNYKLNPANFKTPTKEFSHYFRLDF